MHGIACAVTQNRGIVMWQHNVYITSGLETVHINAYHDGSWQMSAAACYLQMFCCSIY